MWMRVVISGQCLLNNRPYSKDGTLYIKLEKTFEQDIIKIFIPSLASHGSIVFTNSNKSYNKRIDIDIDGFRKNIKIGEKISIPKGDYFFQLKSQNMVREWEN